MIKRLRLKLRCLRKGHQWFIPTQGESLNGFELKECYRCKKQEFTRTNTWFDTKWM